MLGFIDQRNGSSQAYAAHALFITIPPMLWCFNEVRMSTFLWLLYLEVTLQKSLWKLTSFKLVSEWCVSCDGLLICPAIFHLLNAGVDMNCKSVFFFFFQKMDWKILVLLLNIRNTKLIKLSFIYILSTLSGTQKKPTCVTQSCKQKMTMIYCRLPR